MEKNMEKEKNFIETENYILKENIYIIQEEGGNYIILIES